MSSTNLHRSNPGACCGHRLWRLADASGRIATLVLAIIALNGVHPQSIMTIAAIRFGATLLIQGGAVLCAYEAVMVTAGAADASRQPSASAACPLLFLVG